MKATKYIAQTEEFRLATGLPIDSSPLVYTNSASCTIEELSETADALGDSVVTLAGIALQCTNSDVYDLCLNRIENIERVSLSMGIDLDVVMDKIHSANMSKLCSNMTDALMTKEEYNLDGIECYINPVGDMFAVYSSTDQKVNGKEYPSGKLLKNVNWHEPDYSNISEWLKDDRLVDVLTKNLEQV